MKKKFMSTPPFVTTEQELDKGSSKRIQINMTSSVCCSADGQIVYMADPTGLRKSGDGGKTWELLVRAENQE